MKKKLIPIENIKSLKEFEKRLQIVNPTEVPIKNCQRCGKNHECVDFYAMLSYGKLSNLKWGVCPVDNSPIIIELNIVDKKHKIDTRKNEN